MIEHLSKVKFNGCSCKLTVAEGRIIVSARAKRRRTWLVLLDLDFDSYLRNFILQRPWGQSAAALPKRTTGK